MATPQRIDQPPHGDGGRPRNHILASLPRMEFDRLAPTLERVELETRFVLFDVDRTIEHVYFPENSVVSVLSVMADGTAVETATIGREGVVGLPVYLGATQTSAQAFCQVPGAAYRLESEAFRRTVERMEQLRAALDRYTQALFTQVAQASACNRVHTMRERCARWLLQTHDRVDRDEFPLTQQFLSQMLGVRRATVNEAATALQTDGLITYEYGQITVRDRAGLEAAACECYPIIRREYARLLEGRESPRVLESVQTSERGKTTVREGAPRAHTADVAEGHTG